ncbi:hypothetical protein EII34_15235 [Arachnia propionica]|uniref:Uncharacterized protein n=1 Tax=Arachnia propionica TaxID=1750 RepID=A0A3P1T1L4_9ACTN|nr:hypothetical protein [Arachnia propionica]RRD03165.1 hypothetical protein EII34_15235 [Arachnia propionica]
MALLVIEELTPGYVFTGIALNLIGLLSWWQGWKVYTEAVPRFVTTYRGWSSPLLTLPYGGTWLFCMGTIVWVPVAPLALMRIVSIIWFINGIVMFLGFLVWFPRFLLPPWYRRALKAGVPRHDPYAMGAFKALPVEKQKAAVSRRDR